MTSIRSAVVVFLSVVLLFATVGDLRAQNNPFAGNWEFVEVKVDAGDELNVPLVFKYRLRGEVSVSSGGRVRGSLTDFEYSVLNLEDVVRFYANCVVDENKSSVEISSGAESVEFGYVYTTNSSDSFLELSFGWEGVLRSVDPETKRQMEEKLSSLSLAQKQLLDKVRVVLVLKKQ